MIVGYPPFDSFLFREEELVGQWVATFGELPKEWESHPAARNFGMFLLGTAYLNCDTDVLVGPANMETADLLQWLHETYYEDDKPPYFTETQLRAIGQVLLRLLRFRPSERPSAKSILLDPLFGDAMHGHMLK